METPFTAIDNMIDIFIGFFFLLSILYSLYGVLVLHRRKERRDKAMIIYFMVMVISFMHVYQVVQQVSGGGVFAPFRIWDLLNYLQAMLLLMVVQVLGSHLNTNLRAKYKKLP